MTLKNYFANTPAPFIQKNYKILCNFSPSPLIDETIILIETDTETFFRHQIFRNRDMVPRTYFPKPTEAFSETKFSETETLQKMSHSAHHYYPPPWTVRIFPKIHFC